MSVQGLRCGVCADLIKSLIDSDDGERRRLLGFLLSQHLTAYHKEDLTSGMPTYIIRWQGTIYGSSVVSADTEEDARKLAEKGEDRDWDTDSAGYDWEITGVEELPSDDLEAGPIRGKWEKS